MSISDFLVNTISVFLSGFIIGTYVTRYRTAKQIVKMIKESLANGETLKDILDYLESEEPR